MIVGGAIGNIIDRLRYGYVVDFVHVSWFPGIFNLADSAITVGVLMLAGYLLLMGESGAPAARRRPADEALLGELLSQDRWRGDRQQ
jgi:signal peptidase II